MVDITTREVLDVLDNLIDKSVDAKVIAALNYAKCKVGSGPARRKYKVSANACGDCSYVVTTTIYADSRTEAYELGACILQGQYNLRGVENVRITVM